MIWTDERVDLLIKLRQDGLSAAEMMHAMGDISRGAVLGKCHRLGLSVPNGRAGILRVPKSKPLAPLQQPSEPKSFSPPAARPSLGVQRKCCWPFGEPATPGFRFCGEPRARGSYCSDHAQIAFKPREQSQASARRHA